MKKLAIAMCAIGCGAPLAAVPPPVVARVPPAPATHAPPPATWHEVYTRSCEGSITVALPAPDGHWFGFCGLRYEDAHGGFRGHVRLGALALLGADDAVVDLYSSPSEIAVAGIDPTQALLSTAKSGSVEATVVAPDHRSVATLESDDHSRFVVVRKLPSLRPLARVEIDRNAKVDLGFAGDRAILCMGGGVLDVEAGLASLGPAFSKATAMGVSTHGDRAALVLGSGDIEVVSLPEGTAVATVPSRDKPERIALDADGTHVAFITRNRIDVVDLGGEVTSVLDDALGLVEPAALAFGSDGHLYVSDAREVKVYASGATLREMTPMAFEAPPGFHGAVFRDGSLTLTSFDQESEWVQPGLIGRYRRDERALSHRKHGKRHTAPQVDVWVFALDPSELDASDLDAWQDQVRSRYGEVTVLRAWTDGSEKSIELGSFRRDGCDPVDEYVRLTERDGVLYRVVVQVPPGTPMRDVPLDLVFDGPFKETGPARVAVASPPVPPGPC